MSASGGLVLGVLVPRGCVSSPKGGVCSGGGGGGRGVCSQGVCSGDVCSRGVSALGGVGSRGVSAHGGGGIPACTEADTLPVDRITDTCKNITLAQLRCGR